MLKADDAVSATVRKARAAFEVDKCRDVKFRRRQLKNLLRMYREQTDGMVQALHEDLHRNKQESMVFEINFLINDLKNVLQNFEKWLKPDEQNKDLVNFFNTLQIYKDPIGVVLIVGAWNYPFQASLLPLAAAIAAGNCVIIKPSNESRASAEFIRRSVMNYLDNDCYHVCLGEDQVLFDLLEHKFDYIFYTGKANVGRIVHEAAAQHFTPTTLLMGGKNPVYLDSSADLEMATKRILWGKCVNAGQTCIGPEYLLCTQEVQQKFLRLVPKVLQELYGSDPKSSTDYCKIVSDKHFNKLLEFIKGKTVAYGGSYDASSRFIEPTILTNITPNDAIMHEEIHGPILPVMTISNLDEAITFINTREKPLAMYIFSNNRKDVKKLLSNTSCGGVTINDTLMHITPSTLPFGGVGYSGMGSYHGRYSFDTFVHHKSVLKKSTNALLDKMESMRYPPYTSFKGWFTGFMTGFRCQFSFQFVPYVLLFLLGFVITVVVLNL